MSPVLSVFALAAALSQPVTPQVEAHTPSVDLMTVFERGCLDSAGDLNKFIKDDLPPASVATRVSESDLNGLKKLDKDTKAAWLFKSPSGGVLLSFSGGQQIPCLVSSASEVKSDDFFAAFGAMAKRHVEVASAPGTLDNDPNVLLSGYETAMIGRKASVIANAERQSTGNYSARILLLFTSKSN